MALRVISNTTEGPDNLRDGMEGMTYAEHVNKTLVQAVGLVNDETRQPLEQTVYMIILVLSLVGIATNIINIRVFVEQGLTDSTTVGFLFLSVFDLLGSVTLIPPSVCYVIWIVNEESIHRTCMTISYIPSTYPHAMFSKVSNWITVYISVERSLCVILPTKVKNIFTPRTAILAILFINLAFLSYHVPYACFVRVMWRIHPRLNETVAFTQELPIAKAIIKITSASVTILTFCGMAIVFVATGLMVAILFQIRKWRQNKSTLTVNTDDGKTEEEKQNLATSNHKKMENSREIEMIKSVLIVTTVFLVCLLISRVPAVIINTIPGVRIGGINKNLFLLLFSIRFLFDAINSAVNFFFYIKISSKYQQAFSSAFIRRRD